MRKFVLAAALGFSSLVFAAGPVNINTADEKTLAKQLEGVGPEKAAAIVKYRTEKGPFATAADLKKVDGIGDAIFKANEANIRLKDDEKK